MNVNQNSCKNIMVCVFGFSITFSSLQLSLNMISKFKLILIIPHNLFLYGIENIQFRYCFNYVILFKINVY